VVPEQHEFPDVVPGLHESPDVVPGLHVVPDVALGLHETLVWEPELHEVQRVVWARYVVPARYVVRDETLAWAAYEARPWPQGGIRFAVWAVFQSVAQGEIQGETLAALQFGAQRATGHSVRAATRSLAGLRDDSQARYGFQAARSLQLCYRQAECELERPVAWQQQRLQAVRDWR
jgi:hypothetical protein